MCSINGVGGKAALGFGGRLDQNWLSWQPKALHASMFIIVRLLVKLAGNQDRHKISVVFEFWPYQISHFGVNMLLSAKKVPYILIILALSSMNNWPVLVKFYV